MLRPRERSPRESAVENRSRSCSMTTDQVQDESPVYASGRERHIQPPTSEWHISYLAGGQVAERRHSDMAPIQGHGLAIAELHSGAKEVVQRYKPSVTLLPTRLRASPTRPPPPSAKPPNPAHDSHSTPSSSRPLTTSACIQEVVLCLAAR